jgi:hypothetical protein
LDIIGYLYGYLIFDELKFCEVYQF